MKIWEVDGPPSSILFLLVISGANIALFRNSGLRPLQEIWTFSQQTFCVSPWHTHAQFFYFVTVNIEVKHSSEVRLFTVFWALISLLWLLPFLWQL